MLRKYETYFVWLFNHPNKIENMIGTNISGKITQTDKPLFNVLH